MKKIVILQPLFFPWVGVFEQIKLADIYVHFDDVQFPTGRSLTSRIQIKTPRGPQWLTIPVLRHDKQLIKDVKIDNTQNWRDKHLKTLEVNYSKAPYYQDMLAIVELVYNFNADYLCELNIFALEKISEYFNLKPEFMRSSSLETDTTNSQKLLDIITTLDGKTYITGHGAKNYLDHEMFELKGINIEYMDYKRLPYSQLHGEFDPHVSILDLIANTGQNGLNYICSETIHWKKVINKDENGN